MVQIFGVEPTKAYELAQIVRDPVRQGMYAVYLPVEKTTPQTQIDVRLSSLNEQTLHAPLNMTYADFGEVFDGHEFHFNGKVDFGDVYFPQVAEEVALETPEGGADEASS